MKLRKSMVVLILIFSLSAIAIAVQNEGEKDIKLDGGTRGMIDFPHHLHQDAINDCHACHNIFPKKAGIIKDLIKDGTLEKKQVMNKTCLKCHRTMQKAGEKTGPVKCSACHVN